MQVSRSGRRGFELYVSGCPEEVAREAAEGAVRLLDAIPAPAGPMPVVLGPGHGMTGVLIHEACGHALESDFIMKGNSIYAGKVGQKVASPLVNVVDDATLEGEMGWVPFDDEGNDGRRNVLIRNGMLEGYMCDRIGAKALGVAPTGNGRRESFEYAPLPRMTTTFIAPGTSDPGELLTGIRRGLYVARIGGGAGDLSGAGFTFGVDEGYLIEDGRITRPVKGATLTGTGWDVLMGVEGVGNDFQLDPGGGRCGKTQLVPVSTGLPTVRVREMVVGGTDPGR
jgi:TldD protein